MAVAGPLLGVSSVAQQIGVIRSLTDDFLRARAAATSRSRHHPEASDSEDVRWVSVALSLCLHHLYEFSLTEIWFGYSGSGAGLRQRRPFSSRSRCSPRMVAKDVCVSVNCVLNWILTGHTIWTKCNMKSLTSKREVNFCSTSSPGLISGLGFLPVVFLLLAWGSCPLYFYFWPGVPCIFTSGLGFLPVVFLLLAWGSLYFYFWPGVPARCIFTGFMLLFFSNSAGVECITGQAQ